MAKQSNPDRSDAQRAYDREWYKKNRAARLANSARQREKIGERLREYKQTLSCVRCGENHPACLDFHHLDESTKTGRVADMAKGGFGFETILAEIAKCDVLCSNCHRKLHWEEQSGPWSKKEGNNDPA